MEVRYDARADSSPKEPSLAEWVQSYPKLEEALRACSLRFVINLPEESLRNAPRLCFELQEAFWFYLDYLHDNAKKELPKLNQMNFVHLMLEASDVLKAIYETPMQRKKLLQDWRDYCRKVPLKGAVLLNQKLDKCLMVQPWKGDKWTYPRGKINENETEAACAIREVWEETGIDIKGMIDENVFVKADVYGSGCAVKLFLVAGIAEEVPCAPNTRKEISKIGWIQLCKLPGWWDEDAAEEGSSNLRFFSVEDFVPGIQRWVEDQRAARGFAPRQPRWPAHKAARSPPAPKQRPPPPLRRPQSRSPSPRKRESGSSRPRPEAKVPELLPQPPPPPLPAPTSNSRSPIGAAQGSRRGGTFGDPPKPRQADRERFAASKGAANGHAASDPKQIDSRLAGRSSFFSLDLARVMGEFERGWESVR